MSHPLTTWLVVNCSLKMPSFLFRNYCPASVFRTLTPPLPRSRHLCGLFHMLQGTRAPCLQSLSVHPCTICDILRAMQPLSGNQITFRRTFNIDLQMDPCLGLSRPNFSKNNAASTPSLISWQLYRGFQRSSSCYRPSNIANKPSRRGLSMDLGSMSREA
jgi:hypothetical protein